MASTTSASGDGAIMVADEATDTADDDREGRGGEFGVGESSSSETMMALPGDAIFRLMWQGRARFLGRSCGQ